MKGILYIDTKGDFSNKTTSVLRHEGFEVSFVTSYVAGLDTLTSKNFSPTVILCSEQIDNLECVEFLRAARDDRNIKKIPIIILSDNENKDNGIRVLIAGAVDIINRACESNYLLAKLYAQSKLFTNSNKGRINQKNLKISEKSLLMNIHKELNDISKKLSSDTASSHEFNSAMDRFSQYLSKKLA